MNIKIFTHFMPWEIDYALFSYTQLKKSKYYLSEDVKITIHTVLNVSSKLIDWGGSRLPKDFFIEKYNQLSCLLKDYNYISKIYDGDQIYGHLNFQREIIDKNVDYYISVCPDMYFSEHLLYYMTESVRNIKNKYFVITPQICQLWDTSWDILKHPKFDYGTCEGWQKNTDIFDVDNYLHNSTEEIKLQPLNTVKWAGWFDLFNKNFYEKLAPIPEEWQGYGGWDSYGMNISNIFKRMGGDFQQYLLNGSIIFQYSVGDLNNVNYSNCQEGCSNDDVIDGFSNYYKKFIVRQDVSIQRKDFDKNLGFFIERQLNSINKNFQYYK